MWRPKDWEELPFSILTHRGEVVKVIRIKDVETEEKVIFEAGADVMLEALRREGNSKGGRVENDPIRGTGTWLFMPDEEVKDNDKMAF
jgi:hypothetical protein